MANRKNSASNKGELDRAHQSTESALLKLQQAHALADLMQAATQPHARVALDMESLHRLCALQYEIISDSMAPLQTAVYS